MLSLPALSSAALTAVLPAQHTICKNPGPSRLPLSPANHLRGTSRKCTPGQGYSMETKQQRASQDEWDADHYGRNMRFVADLGAPLVDELLQPQAGERILDLGCGDGALTKEIASRGCHVIAVDSSPSMVEKAQQEGLEAYVVDGHALQYDQKFDAVFSNAALHWMSRDPDAIVRGVRRALKPGGRFVAEMGGLGNVAAIVTALLAVCKAHGVNGQDRIPWYFPTALEYRARLEAHGFQVQYMKLVPRPTVIAAGMGEWFTAFAKAFFKGMEAQEREEAEKEALELLRPSLCDSSGTWIADYVRLRFVAKLD